MKLFKNTAFVPQIEYIIHKIIVWILKLLDDDLYLMPSHLFD